MLHAPSKLTIHGPIGVLGVQAFIKRGQSLGSINPLKTSPHLHFFFLTSSLGIKSSKTSSNTFKAS